MGLFEEKPLGKDAFDDESPKANEDGDKQRRYVFPADDRVRISCGTENSWPTRTIVKILYSGGEGCSGVMVGPRHVLTAGHCLHSGGSGGDWFRDITVCPKRNCDYTCPYGEYSWKTMYSVRGWTRSGNFQYDYGLIELWSEPGNGWMSFGYNNGMSTSWNLNIRGYQNQDQLDYKIFNSFETGLVSVGSRRFKHKIDIVRGTSGAPCYLYRSSTGSRVVYGVQSTHSCPSGSVTGTGSATCTSGSGYNRCARITSSRFSQICNWINDPSVC